MENQKKEIRHILQCALETEFGFAPAVSKITIHASSMDGTYVVFGVNGKKYRFVSYVSNVGGMKTVYVGPGTISRWWLL